MRLGDLISHITRPLVVENDMVMVNGMYADKLNINQMKLMLTYETSYVTLLIRGSTIENKE